MNPSDPLIGQQLGNYLLQEPLGRGGMARVYKGLDLGLKRPVAVKIIEEHLRSSASTQRFEREAQAVANLRHPNIVGVYYFGNQDNLYYLVMEYIDGVNLDTVIRQYETNGELMPHADVLRILDAIASALDYAHEAGVIHRDVKPSNILVERNGRPILTDFGLALRVSEGSIGDTFGTPHYISPEQARNSANAVPQSDLYSLGIVAFEMLAGSVPFDDPSPTALAIQHIMAEVPSPRAFNRNLSQEVEQVLFKALAKTPEARFQTGAEFITALRQALEGMRLNPVVVSTAELPPLPPGVAVPPPRHLSLQTALDKVQQELALREAKGQSLTRAPRGNETVAASSQPSVTPPPVKSTLGRWLPYLVAIGAAVIALVVIGILLLQSDIGTPLEPTAIANATAAAASPALLSQAETASVEPSKTSIPPTMTPVPASPTPLPFTSTPLSNTPTLELTPETVMSPTALPVLPTRTPQQIGNAPIPVTVVEPTIETLPAQEPASQLNNPTPFPEQWLRVRFVYNDDTFYWINDSNQSLNAEHIAFERVDGTGRYTGNRWAYWTLEQGRCMEIRFADVANPSRPGGCRPNAFYTPTRGQQEDIFWTGSGQFRILWRGREIAVCAIEAGECAAAVPRNQD